ncbi:hypothetical protein PCIT_b0378 [Pseudoalteromonas citrea]|uniref:histidine kinase n=2 Tax=Pseudoalteromonas citrea TaxID=43655 RepID=A0AAD4FPV6_9GAMM|nr:sensor histidine kinase [Pseudoalteromonas citrea]KAF7764388.1 hypothetical protein PCIT_b0378 [Pseudoalteromonas citrea]
MHKRLKKHSFFARLCLLIIGGAVSLFWLIDLLANHTEIKMSQLEQQHQQTLQGYGDQAEKLYLAGNLGALEHYVNSIQHNENTWAAVVERHVTPLANGTLSPLFSEHIYLGRDISWKIHLYFNYNPIMDVPFSDNKTHFLIQLPAHMRPGHYWKITYLSIQFILPIIFLAGFCILIYRAIMKPLKQLERATKRFASGQLDTRIHDKISSTDGEFQQIAATFDQMANCIEHTIESQRQFIADFSHEIRTPIARVETALSCAEQSINPQKMLQRIRKDCHAMRTLAEDTLTLTWLENESAIADHAIERDTFDLVDLIDSIIEDVQFEAPHIEFSTTTPESYLIFSNSRVLGQVIENILRNASRYANAQITTTMTPAGNIEIADDGCGVPEDLLRDIFKPFYRVTSKQKSAGFGLGLALCQRHIHRLQGAISAKNNPSGGLIVIIKLNSSQVQM